MERTTRNLVRDYVVTIFIAATIALLIRNFVIEAYRVPNSLMKPTLIDGDTLFVDKWTYSWNESTVPERGEVVVFSGLNAPEGQIQDFIKRVVGLPGDTIEIKNGLVSVNGKTLPHKPIQSSKPEDKCFIEQIAPSKSYSICVSSPSLELRVSEKVPSDSVFVLADYRIDAKPDGKADSRSSAGISSRLSNRTSSNEKKFRKGWGVVPLTALKGKAVWIWLSIESPDTSHFISLPRFRWERMFRRIE